MRTRKGREKEQETRATVGGGMITENGEEVEPEGLNRDTEKAQEITRDEVTGALEYSVTVDHEVAVFVAKHTVKGLTKAVEATAKAGVKVTEGMASAIANALKGLGSEDVTSGVTENNNRYESQMGYLDENGYRISMGVSVYFDENGQPVVAYSKAISYAGNPELGNNLSLSSKICNTDTACANLAIENGNLTVGQTTLEDYARDLQNTPMPESMGNKINEMLAQANAFLDEHWTDSEVRTGLMGVQEAWWDSSAGRFIGDTMDTANIGMHGMANVILWGGAELATKAGIMDRMDPNDQLFMFSGGVGYTLDNTVRRLPEERQQDLGLISDAAMVLGGARVVSGGVVGIAKSSGGRSAFKLIDNNVGAVGDIKGKTVYRYMSEAEFKAIQESNLLRGGRPGETFMTEDLYKTSKTAQRNLALKDTPEVRVKVEVKNNPKLIKDGTRVGPLHGQRGGGTEIMTTEPVKVKIINSKKLSDGKRNP